MISYSFTNQGLRTTENKRTSKATRSITCFEVLDYDSLTHVRVGSKFKDVVCVIYKRVKIVHEQNRKYLLNYETEEANNKDNKMQVMPLWYLDWAPATDDYDYTGTRAVEYILCLVVGVDKYVLTLGSVNINVRGSYKLSGTNKELIEGGPDPDNQNASFEASIEGPLFTVTGSRFYGVSVNCGQKIVTFSYDVEQFVGSLSNNGLFQYDSPINAEDYNEHWSKVKRVVGAMNYYGVSGSRDFPCDRFPDKVLAVNYKTLSKIVSTGG